MPVPKFINTAGIVILVILFIVLLLFFGSHLSQITTSTISMTDVKDKLGIGPFVYFWSNGLNVTRVTIETQNMYEMEKIANNGEYTDTRGKYTINQIKSNQDTFYHLLNAHIRNDFTEYNGRYYLMLDCKPTKYMLDTKDKSYKLWSPDGKFLEAVSTGKSDYEIYVVGQEYRTITYNATIEVTTNGNITSYSETDQTPHLHKVTGKTISATFQKSGEDDTELTAILFDSVTHIVVRRVTTDKAYGTVSLKS
jgi:hypothetical protein